MEWFDFYDLASEVVDDYCHDEHGAYSCLDDESSKLKQICDEIQLCANKFNCTEFSVDIVEDTNELMLTIVCESLEYSFIKRNNFVFPKMCEDVIISSDEDDENISVSFYVKLKDVVLT